MAPYLLRAQPICAPYTLTDAVVETLPLAACSAGTQRPTRNVSQTSENRTSVARVSSPWMQGTVEQVDHASGWGTLRDELGALRSFETEWVDEDVTPGSRVRFKTVGAGQAFGVEFLGPSLADVVATLHAHSIATSFDPSASHEAYTLGELLGAHYGDDTERGMREGFLAVDRRFASEHADVVALLGGWGGVQITTRDLARPPQDLWDAVAQVNAALCQRGAAFLIASLLSYGDVIALLRIPAAQKDAFRNAGVVDDVQISRLRVPVVLLGAVRQGPADAGGLACRAQVAGAGGGHGRG